MNPVSQKLIIAIWLILFVVTGSSAQPDVTLQSLLKEMVNREQLARYPDPYYTTRQFSSYDRRSKNPGTTLWFANWDRSQFIRTERHNGHKEYVMFDTQGPGTVVRFWMTFAGKGAGGGTLRLYFDGEKQPTIKGNVLDILSGGQLAGPPLSTSVSPKSNYKIRGHDLYLPIPYGKSLKITYESPNIKSVGAKGDGEAVYYNITYRTYEQGTTVSTFSRKQLQKAESVLQEVQQKLAARTAPELPGSTQEHFSQILQPGQSYTRSISGPAAIRRLSLKLIAQNINQALRSTILKLSFDGQQTIWTPVGTFFGTGYQYRYSKTWYSEVDTNRTMSVYWVMPFQVDARLEIENIGKQPVEIAGGSIDYSDWNWTDRSMHFGATWHPYFDLYTGKKKNMDGEGGPFDINYTHLKGKGVYVGDMLSVFNTAYDWWGEGDEKVYVDGEAFPSHFGTGSEDYYGYAWVRPEVFTGHPFISQPDGSGNVTPGYTINLRYRSLDAIPFQSELKFDMEMWHWASTYIDYAPASFFYLKPGSRITLEPDRKSAKEAVALERSDIIEPRLQGNRMEAEHLVVDSISAGSIRYQYLNEPELSNHKQLWWKDASKGDHLIARFMSDREGSYKAVAQFVKSFDYGTIKLSVNGKTVLPEIDLHSDQITTIKRALEPVNLRKGANKIRIDILDQNAQNKEAFVGFDYLDFYQY